MTDDLLPLTLVLHVLNMLKPGKHDLMDITVGTGVKSDAVNKFLKLIRFLQHFTPKIRLSIDQDGKITTFTIIERSPEFLKMSKKDQLLIELLDDEAVDEANAVVPKHEEQDTVNDLVETGLARKTTDGSRVYLTQSGRIIATSAAITLQKMINVASPIDESKKLIIE